MAYSALQLAARYVQFQVTAKSGKGHGVHSPFVYDFITRVLNDRQSYEAYRQVENYRATLLQQHRKLAVEDWGAGSSYGQAAERSVASIARRAAKSPRLAQLLFRIARYVQPQQILELGTSLGISTAYLALACPTARIISIEGAPAVAQQARENFLALHLSGVECLTGRFEDKLPEALNSLSTVDLAYIDGNHRKEPTLRYFQQLLACVSPKSVFIFDDVHWSREMEEAWSDIRHYPQVQLSIDLFHFGLVFFRSGFHQPQHFNIRL